MKIPKTPNYLKTFPNITIFNLLKRFLSTLHMVLLGIIGFVITICWLLKLLLLLVSYLYVGLNVILMTILMTCWKQITKITLLRQIQTQYILLLTDWLVKCLKRVQILQKLSTSWTRSLEIRLNLLLIKVIKIWLRM